MTATSSISIQHLFRFDAKHREELIEELNFNTTFVSVRLWITKILILFDFISIQHLFRFDSYAPVQQYNLSSFQYNICFGSTIVPKIDEIRLDLFQYNICFGSTS